MELDHPQEQDYLDAEIWWYCYVFHDGDIVMQ